MRQLGRSARTRLLIGVSAVAILCGGGQALAQDKAPITIAPQPLASALYEFGGKTGTQVIFASTLASAKHTGGVAGESDQQLALAQLLAGTGLTFKRDGDTFVILAGEGGSAPQSSGAAGDGAEGTVEALIVTAQKREEDIQDVPIAISAFTQEDLTRSQVAGGPDLMTQVPNMTFTKTNFSSYSIQIRGIGTQAISATVDAAVAVAFNNSSMIRNRFFEQEFYDLERIEVLRGPQGTLYGRNATAGVVNIISAKPRFTHDARLSADIANYGSTRLEGMVNIPLVEDIVALRLAGAWTKRDGYVTNAITGDQIDGRDLWSTRLSLRAEPMPGLSANLIWEHFEEDDDRLRSGKQLCHRHQPDEIGGVPFTQDGGTAGSIAATYSQGCLPVSMYSPEAYETPNGNALPYYSPLSQIGNPTFATDPYVSTTQSRDLRVIESTLTPKYQAETNTVELQLSYDLTPSLTLASETAYTRDELFSFQDFNRFNTKPGAFDPSFLDNPHFTRSTVMTREGVFCDPQLGCSDRLVLADLSTAKSTQFSQEFRLSSDYATPFNFSLGANFVRYDTEDKYYVFANSLSLWAASYGEYGLGADDLLTPYVPGVTTNAHCLNSRWPGDPNKAVGVLGCIPIDPNPIESLDDTGHNYFLSRNPYRLISYAVFGEAYYQVADNLKLTAGLRWTADKKTAPLIPSWLIASESYGYPVADVVEKEWREPTGRLTLDWKPDLGVTDETLIYGSYARGYKAGGMNPPPAVIALYTTEYYEQMQESIAQPKSFAAEFVDAFELGAKNTLLDGALTLNLAAFYYDYKDYQLSQIVNRSAVTQNFDAQVWGLEIEADWRPLENLRLGFKGGYQDTQVVDGEQAIDLMDRTAGHSDWVVSRPFPTVPSNCILPLWLVTYGGRINAPHGGGGIPGACVHAYYMNLDPVTKEPYVPNPPNPWGQNGEDWTGYPGFDPTTAPNNGEGFFKDLSGNELPNAPHFTGTLTADYTLPLPNDWLATLHSDVYYQSEAWTRIFNMEGYDKLKAYTNVNLAAIFTNEDAGWKVMAYVKNVFDRDSITGAFLNSDDTGLTTNVFLTEPRLYGLRVTKEWAGNSPLGGLLSAGAAENPLTLEIGGSLARIDAPATPFSRDVFDAFPEGLDPAASQTQDLDWGDGRAVKLTYSPKGSVWDVSLSARFGRANGHDEASAREKIVWAPLPGYALNKYNYVSGSTTRNEDHTLVDFAVGRDFGLGGSMTSHLGAGLRYAEFDSRSASKIIGAPDYVVPSEPYQFLPLSHTEYTTTFEAERTFEGAGLIAEWDLTAPIWMQDAAQLAVEGGLSAGVLFGKQKAAIRGEGYTDFKYATFYGPAHDFSELPSVSSARSKSVTVPTLGASLGLSYDVGRVSIGAGYQWERFYNVIDGGYLERSSEDRTIDGPYFKFALGFGG